MLKLADGPGRTEAASSHRRSPTRVMAGLAGHQALDRDGSDEVKEQADA